MYLAMRSFNDSYIADEETGAELNYAVYMRNKLVEEHTGAKVNFTISTITTTGQDQDIKTGCMGRKNPIRYRALFRIKN